jgi:hypothetical protein
MKPPTTLSEVAAAAATWDSAYNEVLAEKGELVFDATGVTNRGELIPMDDMARTRLFKRVGAPSGYFAQQSATFQALALNEHAARGDFGAKPNLVLRGGALMTIVRSDLIHLPNAAVVRAVAEGLERESEGLTVAEIDRDEERFDLRLISPMKAIDVRPGDIVQSGLHIVHHRFGAQATLIEAFILRLVCGNGMTRRECVRDGIARTRKLPVNFPYGAELQMNQIRRLTQQTWNGLQAQLEALQATGERAANVPEMLTRWLQRGRISVNVMMPRLMTAWRAEGEENTHYGAVNALTRVATHDLDLSERQRRVLASLAGILAFSEVHVCPRCFSVLSSGAAGDGHTD